ncbi:unnamed protein product, partial [Rhizoctonia solani]
MSTYPGTRVCLPPELPPYLKKIRDIKPIIGIPSDEEVIGIHTVVRVANRVVDVQDMGDPVLVAQLSEHLFNAQMVRYRSKYSGAVFPENTTYIPPALPAHVLVQLGPITGAPTEEEVVGVQKAIRSYEQFANVPSMFDPHVNMELSQYLFDIQMAKYTQRAGESHASYLPHKTPVTIVEQSTHLAGGVTTSTNNAGTGADIIESNYPTQAMQNTSILDALERSNRLAEQTNQLVERSNQIAERANQLVEGSAQPIDQFNRLTVKLNELFERWNGHFEKSNQLAKESTKPTERLGDILEKVNKVLVAIQHAIIRNHKGNTRFTLDCLVNENGETPGVSSTVDYWDLKSLFEHHTSSIDPPFPIHIDGVVQDFRLPSWKLGAFLNFYGIGEGLCENGSSTEVYPGKYYAARARLRKYWTSCL